MPLERNFSQLIVKHGKVMATLQAGEWMLRGSSDALNLMEMLADRFRESPAEFECWVNFGQTGWTWIKWRALHDTTGVVNLVYEAQALDQMLLLLTGEDMVTEEVALRALEQSYLDVTPDTIAQIRTTPRPLLVSVGKVGLADADLAFNMFEWCIAAAFFQRRGLN